MTYSIPRPPAANIAKNAVWVAHDQAGNGEWMSPAELAAWLGVVPTTSPVTTTPLPVTTPPVTSPPVTTPPSTGGTSLAAPAAHVLAACGFTPSNKEFSDYFAGTTLDPKKWNAYMATAAFGRWGNQGKLPAPLSAAANSNSNPMYNAEYYSPQQLAVNNGLTMVAKPDTSEAGYSYVSGCICTEGLFKFGPGSLLRVTAQEPGVPGEWFSIWCMDASAEIDPQEGGYGSTPNYELAFNYHGGKSAQIVKDMGIDLTNGLHLYEMAWNPNGTITEFIDGLQIGTESSATGQAELIIALAVATQAAASFHEPNNGQPMTAKVGAVEVWV